MIYMYMYSMLVVLLVLYFIHFPIIQVIVKNPTPTGDVLLDEALKHIRETSPPDNIQSWIELLSGK